MTNATKILAAFLTTTFLSNVALADPVAAPATAPSTAPTSAPATVVVGPHTLTVTVTGVRSARGTIRAQLLKADAAAGVAKSAGASMAVATPGTTTLTFVGLADGDYAVQLFHDEDGDGQMKTNMFGIPSEGYSFSNSARGSFGPPKFSDMKVTITANTTTIAPMAY
jgi:uncharacterized protein (DUF2141 family)